MGQGFFTSCLCGAFANYAGDPGGIQILSPGDAISSHDWKKELSVMRIVACGLGLVVAAWFFFGSGGNTPGMGRWIALENTTIKHWTGIKRL
jgi:hypothetical protein